jgi:hypothetical protein
MAMFTLVRFPDDNLSIRIVANVPAQTLSLTYYENLEVLCTHDGYLVVAGEVLGVRVPVVAPSKKLDCSSAQSSLLAVVVVLGVLLFIAMGVIVRSLCRNARQHKQQAFIRYESLDNDDVPMLM